MMQLLKRIYVNCFAAHWYESAGFVFFSADAARRDAESFGRGYYEIWRWTGLGECTGWRVVFDESLVEDCDEDDSAGECDDD